MTWHTTQLSIARSAPRRLVAGAVATALTAFGLAGCSAGETMELSAPGGDTMASCLPFDVATLSEMSPAFSGTVVELEDSVATLKVDRWFTGGDAERVSVTFTPGTEALIGTPAFELDQSYLITAADGVVNGCGYSGPATSELESAFEAAFPG